jgi:hypothetical protein
MEDLEDLERELDDGPPLAVAVAVPADLRASDSGTVEVDVDVGVNDDDDDDVMLVMKAPPPDAANDDKVRTPVAASLPSASPASSPGPARASSSSSPVTGLKRGAPGSTSAPAITLPASGSSSPRRAAGSPLAGSSSGGGGGGGGGSNSGTPRSRRQQGGGGGSGGSSARTSELALSGAALLEAVYASMRDTRVRLGELSKALRAYAKAMAAVSEAGTAMADAFLALGYPSNPDVADGLRATATNLRVVDRTYTHIASEFLPGMADALKGFADKYAKAAGAAEAAHRKPLADAQSKLAKAEKKAVQAKAKLKGDAKTPQYLELKNAYHAAARAHEAAVDAALLDANAAEREHSLAVYKLLDGFSERMCDAMDRFLTAALENEKTYHARIVAATHCPAVGDDIRRRASAAAASVEDNGEAVLSARGRRSKE